MAVRALTALLRDGELRSPAVGLWRGAPADGEVVAPGESIGQLEVLGVVHPLVAPAEARGVVSGAPGGRARVPVGYGDRLVALEAIRGEASATQPAESTERSAATGLVLRAPSSGRFYRRPGPGKDAFVEVGDEVTIGHTVCLLEVMKTFNRVVYGGDGLPERARVAAVVPEDESDLDAGDVILELESI